MIPEANNAISKLYRSDRLLSTKNGKIDKRMREWKR